VGPEGLPTLREWRLGYRFLSSSHNVTVQPHQRLSRISLSPEILRFLKEQSSGPVGFELTDIVGSIKVPLYE
jgi:hypothetical protein